MLKVRGCSDFGKCRTRLVKIFITRRGYKYHMHTINECNADKIKNYELKILSRIKCSIFNTLLSLHEFTVCISIWKAHKNVLFALFFQPVFGFCKCVCVMSFMSLIQIRNQNKNNKNEKTYKRNPVFVHLCSLFLKIHFWWNLIQDPNKKLSEITPKLQFSWKRTISKSDNHVNILQ